MRRLTHGEELELRDHLRYVIQKVRRYADSRNDPSPRARLHAGAQLATAIEDAEDFLKNLKRPSFWQRVQRWLGRAE